MDASRPHPHRQRYVIIYVWLTFLTVLEVGMIYLPVPKSLMISALILLALAKAVLVALFYMHLSTETPLLRRLIAVCLGLPALYAVVLIGEATWRMLT